VLDLSFLSQLLLFLNTYIRRKFWQAELILSIRLLLLFILHTFVRFVPRTTHNGSR
jgi:hypothetical protein